MCIRDRWQQPQLVDAGGVRVVPKPVAIQSARAGFARPEIHGRTNAAQHAVISPGKKADSDLSPVRDGRNETGMLRNHSIERVDALVQRTCGTRMSPVWLRLPMTIKVMAREMSGINLVS